MKKQTNPNSLKNLKRLGIDVPAPTKDEAKSAGIMGGIASGKARTERKTFKKMLESMLANKAPKSIKELINEYYPDMTQEELSTMDIQKVLGLQLVQRGISVRAEGNKAFEIIRDTIGEKPEENININQDTTDYESWSVEDLRTLNALKAKYKDKK
jgi:hypothetical protein